MKSNNILVSVGITLTFAAIIVLLFYPSGSPLGDFFDLFFVLIITHYVSIIYGILVLLMRLLRLFRNNGSLLYVLAGTMNILLAFVGIILYFSNQADREWLHKCILNLFLGFLILADRFVNRGEVKR